MCTTTQNIYIPADGIETDAGHKTFAEVGADLATAVEGLLSDPARAAGVLGAIVNDDVDRASEELDDAYVRYAG